MISSLPSGARFASVGSPSAPSQLAQLLTACFALFVAAAFWTVSPAEAQHSRNPTAAQQVDADTVEAGRFDDGRMWTFDAPPLDYFENRYGFRPSEEWLEKARLGTLRIPGCTASFVSPNGLMLTNHHCSRSHASKVGRSGEKILQNGFVASSLDAERKVPGLYADQLVRITDVTGEVRAAMEAAETDAERMQARSEVTDSLKTALVERAGGEGYRAEIISLYDGAQYKGYTFRRYQDVRLVMIPELQLGYYGGDTDNFTYPRYALDMALFRVYGEDGEPLQPEHYFEWETQGSRPGDAAFVVGNPGSTLRLETYEQLLFRRDVQDVGLRTAIENRVDALKAYRDAVDDPPESLDNRIFGLENALKLYNGRVQALNDSYIMTRIRKGDRNFQEAVRQDSSLRAQYGGLIDSMAAIQQQKRKFADTHRAFQLMRAPYASATLLRALAIARAGDVSGDQKQKVLDEIKSAGTQPQALDREYMAGRLAMMQAQYGADSEVATQLLGGATPSQRADEVLSTSVLADSAEAVSAFQNGSIPADDPAMQAVGAVADRYRDYRSAWSGLTARQDAVASELGRARFAVYGTDVPPDATFSLRLSDGVVQGYEYNGTRAPAHTTFYGMYGHYHTFGAGSEWDLPDRWLNPPSSFDRSTPVNMVSSTDITGGNSGSPLLNKDLKLIGLIFDGNIESLAGDFIFMPGRMRAVSVDVRGMLEALDEIYDADRLVQEVTGGAFVETERAASSSE